MPYREWEEKTKVSCPFCGAIVKGGIKWCEDDNDKTERGFPTPMGHPYAWPLSGIIDQKDHSCAGIQEVLRRNK